MRYTIDDFNSHKTVCGYQSDVEATSEITNYAETNNLDLVQGAKLRDTFRTATWNRDNNLDLLFATKNIRHLK